MISNRSSNSAHDNRAENNTSRRKTPHFIKNKVVRKRLIIFSISAGIILSFLTYQIFLHKYILYQKKTEYKELQKELKVLKKERELLMIENKNLDSDEYIMKFARNEYFLSKEGEIIFSINTKSKK